MASWSFPPWHSLFPSRQHPTRFLPTQHLQLQTGLWHMWLWWRHQSWNRETTEGVETSGHMLLLQVVSGTSSFCEGRHKLLQFVHSVAQPRQRQRKAAHNLTSLIVACHTPPKSSPRNKVFQVCALAFSFEESAKNLPKLALSCYSTLGASAVPFWSIPSAYTGLSSSKILATADRTMRHIPPHHDLHRIAGSNHLRRSTMR